MGAFIEWTGQFPEPVGLTVFVSAMLFLVAAIVMAVYLATSDPGRRVALPAIAAWVIGCWVYVIFS